VLLLRKIANARRVQGVTAAGVLVVAAAPGDVGRGVGAEAAIAQASSAGESAVDLPSSGETGPDGMGARLTARDAAALALAGMRDVLNFLVETSCPSEVCLVPHVQVCRLRRLCKGLGDHPSR